MPSFSSTRCAQLSTSVFSVSMLSSGSVAHRRVGDAGEFLILPSRPACRDFAGRGVRTSMEVATHFHKGTELFDISRTARRVVIGAMGAQIAIPPFLVISRPQPMRRMLRSRCSSRTQLGDRFLRTISPLQRHLTAAHLISLTIRAFAMVDLPEPEKPVKNTVKPSRNAAVWFSARLPPGKENHWGFPDLRPDGDAIRCRRCSGW